MKTIQIFFVICLIFLLLLKGTNVQAQDKTINIYTSPPLFIFGFYNIGIELKTTLHTSIFTSYFTFNREERDTQQVFDINAYTLGYNYFVQGTFKDSAVVNFIYSNLTLEEEDKEEIYSGHGFEFDNVTFKGKTNIQHYAVGVGYFFMWEHVNLSFGVAYAPVVIVQREGDQEDIARPDGLNLPILANFSVGYAF